MEGKERKKTDTHLAHGTLFQVIILSRMEIFAVSKDRRKSKNGISFALTKGERKASKKREKAKEGESEQKRLNVPRPFRFEVGKDDILIMREKGCG